MWTILTILLWLLAAMFALLLVALAAPLQIECRASVGDAFRYSVALRPFGRLGPRFAVVDSDKPTRKKEKKARPERKSKTGVKPQSDPRKIVAAAFRLISEIFASLSVDKAAFDLRFGASDPAETGAIFGCLAPLIYGTQSGRGMDVRVEPVFDRVLFDGRAELNVKLRPARLVLPLVRFGWTTFGPFR